MTEYRPTIQILYVLGTKQRQESLKYLKVTISFTICCGFKHIHTHDLNTALVFFTLRDDLSRHMNTLLTTDGEAHGVQLFHSAQTAYA